LVITVTFVCQNVLNIISSTSVSRSIRIPNHSHLNVCCVTILYLFFCSTPFLFLRGNTILRTLCHCCDFYHSVHTPSTEIQYLENRLYNCTVNSLYNGRTRNRSPPVTEGFRFMQVLLVWALWTIKVFR